MKKEFIHPEKLANFPKLFTQAVTVKTGEMKTVYISGQVAIDPEGKVVGKGDLGAQAGQVFENLFLALEAAGAKPADVVKLNINCWPGSVVKNRAVFRGIGSSCPRRLNQNEGLILLF
jgi:enamine deaminase RidA (YjgF/YER057c/UK114 family)